MRRYIFLAIILALSYWAVKSLFIPGFFPIHDDTQVSRVYEMSKALSDGMFPVRWVPDLGYGYGYPLFNFYAPLSYYFGGVLTILGLDPLLATKITFSTGVFLSGIFMFMLGRVFWGNIGGLISAVLYVYAPYSALNIYVRGDLAEVWGYAFVPLFFYGLINIYKNLSLKYIFISALGLSAVILSHNLTAYMTSIIFLFTVAFLSITSRDRIKFIAYSLLSFVLGSLLASFYSIPALLEMQYTNVFSQIGGGANFRDHFVCLGQFWESNWGFGGSAPGCFDGMSFRLGRPHLAVALLSILALFVKKELYAKQTAFLVSSFFLSLFLMIPLSKIVWETMPLMEFLQYPWRFLIYASFFASLLGGGSIILIRLFPKNIFKHGRLVYPAIVIVLAIYIYGKLFIPQTILPKTALDYTDKSALNYKISKISDEYMPKDFEKPENIEEVPDSIFNATGSGEIKLIERKTHKIKAKANVVSESTIHANIAYFPAWKVMVNGKETSIDVVGNGFNFKVQKGESEINLVFSQTPVEKISNVLSIAALLVIITGIIFRKKIARIL